MQAPAEPLPQPFYGVMHVYAGNRYGGIESMLATMARSPAFAGQSYALFHRARLWEELRAAGADVIDVGPFRTRHPWQALALRRRLRAALEARSIQTVVTHMSIPHALASPVVGSRLLVYFAHEWHTGRHWSERWSKCARRPDAVLTGSAFVAGSTHTLFPGIEPCVVYYAAEIGSPGTEADRQAVRCELATPADHRVIVNAARFSPYKGNHVLLEALGALRERGDWTAWIAGGPQSEFEERYAAELRARAQDLGIEGRVRFLGERRDVGRLVRAADLLCQANVGPEPFGITFAEALGAGIPVVTSNFGGAPEIVTPELGELVPPGDARALARALGRTLDDAEKKAFVRVRGPERAREICSPARVAERFRGALAAARGNVRP